MPRKTTILILILAIITGVLIFLAVRSDTTQNLINQTISNEPTAIPTVNPYAVLSFQTQEINVTTQLNQKVDILVDTAGQSASGAQVELSYDPRIITNVSFTKPTNPFFGSDQIELNSRIEQERGRASYAAAIPLSGTEKSGKGSIITLNFRIVKIAGVANTNISFLPQSAVTSLQSPKSILQNTQPLTITLTQ